MRGAITIAAVLVLMLGILGAAFIRQGGQWERTCYADGGHPASGIHAAPDVAAMQLARAVVGLGRGRAYGSDEHPRER